MAFVWNDELSAPPPIVPIPVADGEMSFEQKEVANNVIVHPIYGAGTLLWNIATPPDEGDNGLSGDFDIVYRLPSLNVHDLHVSHLNTDNLTALFSATINTANIGVATINTANIVNATIANGRMGVNPTANLQIATKEYVDALMANSVPLGGNLQLLIQAAGDLLVGVSDNTAERLPVGTTEKQLLAVGGSGNTGLHWIGPLGSASSHRGMVIGTDWDAALKNTQVQLVTVDEIVMDDGTRVTSGWNGLTASIASNVATSGVGYLDTGVVLPNTCYEVYAIRNSSNGAQGLLLHRALDRNPDIHLPVAVSTVVKLNTDNGTGVSSSINVAQRFIATKSGPFTGIDLTLRRIGTPVGNVWVTIETDNTVSSTSNASGIIVATSRKITAGRIGALTSDFVRIRFPFDTTGDVSGGVTYWAVVHTDCPRADLFNNTNHVQVAGQGTASVDYPTGAVKIFNANTNGWALSNSAFLIDSPGGPGALYFRTFIEANNTSVVMPTGYDQKCLISYCSTNIRTTLREYHQQEYRMSMAFHYTWCYHYNGGLNASRADNPGANNSPVVAFPEPIHMGEMVPPVPCIVWIYKYTGLGGGGSMTGTGDLTATEIPVQSFTEAQGALYTLINGNQQIFLGPLFIEQSAHVNQSSGGTFGALHVAGIEF